MTVAALYVDPKGCYAGLPDVEVWDEARDARKYAGPHPVVAHPPCQRWGRFWSGGPMLGGTSRAKKLGDDHGCFTMALYAVRKFGGVLEHPEASHAWSAHELNKPPRWGGWVVADWRGGWTCCVEQGHWDHRARKATWLYANGVTLPEMIWGPSQARAYLTEVGMRSAEDAKRKRAAPDWKPISRLTSREAAATPPAFRDLLLSIARSAR